MATERNTRNNRLQELSGSDYEVVDGEPDIRGWDVKDVNGRRIGEVDDLIFDVESRKVRYLKIDLEGNVLDLEPRDVLVPIGLAELDHEDDDVILTNVSSDQLRSLPEYDDDDNLSTEYESGIRRVFGGVTGPDYTTAGTSTLANDSSTLSDRDTDFYNHDHFNDDNLFRNRRDRNTDRTYNDTTTNSSTSSNSNQLQSDDLDSDRRGLRLRNRIGDRTDDTVSNDRLASNTNYNDTTSNNDDWDSNNKRNRTDNDDSIL